MEQDRNFVQSLANGLSVIRCFGPERPDMSLAEVAEASGLSRAAARRIVLTLMQLGYIGQSRRRFSLRPSVLDLGYSYLSSVPVWEIIQPFLENLARQLRESCSASVREGQDIVYMARVPTTRIMSLHLTVGTRLPAFCTSMGRVLIAFDEEVERAAFLRACRPRAYTSRTVTDRTELAALIERARKDGWALVDQELEIGLISLAVPVLNAAGKAVAAMNVAAHASRVTKRAMLREFLPVLQEAGQRASRSIAKQPRMGARALGKF